MAHFAERGFKATTIRGVARDAGVSPSSVQHHFSNKDGLREACDTYVSNQLRRGIAENVTRESTGDTEAPAASLDEAPPILRYLARALTEDSPTADTLFDEIVELTEAHLADLEDAESYSWGAPRSDQAAVYTAMKLGVIVLHSHLSRNLDVDPLTPEGIARVQPAILDIVAPHLRSNA